MSVDSFVPEVWSARILSNIHAASQFAALCNRNYEGEIKNQGDTVRINSIGPISELTYTPNSDLTAPETLTDAQRTLVIDQHPAFNFQVDDVDKVQANVELMGEATREAAYMLRDSQDRYLAGLYTEADAGGLTGLGTTGTPISMATATTFYDKLLIMRQRLIEANHSMDGAAVVVPPWAETKLLSDARFTAATNQGDGRLINGEIGRAAGFRIVVSNNVATVSTTKYKIMAFVPSAITIAEQHGPHVEAYRLERRFADGVKGGLLWGAKCVRPTGLVVLTATEA